MTSDEVAKYPAENPKYDRTKPFYPPDPDLIGKYFAVWVPVDYPSDCSTNAEAVVYSIIHTCFDGIVVSSLTRKVPGARNYCHVCMIPTSRLTFGNSKSGTFNLFLKMNQPREHDWYDRDYVEPLLQATQFTTDEKTANHHRQELNAIRQLAADIRRTTDAKSERALYKEHGKRTAQLRKECAEYLFDQGSDIETIDGNPPEYNLITPFRFPPGYVWDTARALTTTFGDNSPLIKRFCELAMPTGPQRPDEWWTRCDDPQSVFIILFSRMLGPERWQYTLACLESTLGKTVDWNATL